MANEQALLQLRMHNHADWSLESDWQQGSNKILLQAQQQLDEYFSGTRKHFSVPLAHSDSAFQQQVWQALRSIEFACTCNYQQLAQQIARPKAMRAVGSANGANPLSSPATA